LNKIFFEVIKKKRKENVFKIYSFSSPPKYSPRITMMINIIAIAIIPFLDFRNSIRFMFTPKFYLTSKNKKITRDKIQPSSSFSFSSISFSIPSLPAISLNLFLMVTSVIPRVSAISL